MISYALSQLPSNQGTLDEICDRALNLAMGLDIHPHRPRADSKADVDLMPPPSLSINVPAIASLSSPAKCATKAAAR